MIRLVQKVGGAGLCDLHPPVFISIYEEAAVKPASVQVRSAADEEDDQGDDGFVPGQP